MGNVWHPRGSVVCFHGIHVIVTKSLGGGTWGEALLKQHDIPLSSGSFLRPCLASLWVDETLGAVMQPRGVREEPSRGRTGQECWQRPARGRLALSS